MKLIQIINILCMIFTSAVVLTCSPFSTNETVTIRYVVSSNAERTIDISVRNNTGGTDSFESTDSSWSKEYQFEVEECGIETAGMSAFINEYSTKYVTCSVYEDGSLCDTETSNGQFVSASVYCYIYNNEGINCPSEY